MIIESKSRLSWFALLQENTFGLFLGDFNIDLLKFVSHADSKNFTNSLGTFFFNHIFFNQLELLITPPHQLTISFFNSNERFTVSGNVVYDLTDFK